MTSVLRKLAVVGFGKMGNALVAGAVQKGALLQENIIVASPSLCNGARSTSFTVAKDNIDAVTGTQIVILGTKPKDILKVSKEIASAIDKNAVLVSLAAGTQISAIAQYFPPTQPIIRIMSSTAALYGEAVHGYFQNQHVTPEQAQLIKTILESTGKVVELSKENDMDIITAASGSGLAFQLSFISHMIEAASDLGLPSDIARLVVTQTVSGMNAILKNGGDIQEEIKKITTPNGTTHAGFKYMREANVRSGIMGGIFAARMRARELGEPTLNNTVVKP